MAHFPKREDRVNIPFQWECTRPETSPTAVVILFWCERLCHPTHVTFPYKQSIIWALAVGVDERAGSADLAERIGLG